MCALLGRSVALQVITILLMLQVAWGASPSRAAGADFDIPLKELKPPAAKEFEIPLSDLKKGGKKAKRSEGKRQKGTLKKEQAQQEPPLEAAGSAAEDSRKAAAPTAPTGGPAAEFTPETQLLQRQAKPEKSRGADDGGAAGKGAPTADQISIIHDPYSYVVTGRPTLIHAVIIASPETIRSIRCRFRSAETGGFAHVPMKKVTDTLYTYTATLPPLSPDSGSVRYSIIITNASNREISSREFATPVRATSVVPGWQTGTAQGKIKVWLEDPPNPLVGFSDIMVEEAGRP